MNARETSTAAGERVSTSPAGVDWARIRQRLATADGPTYWRGLQELADSPEFAEMVHREFAPGLTEWTDDVSRRRFLKLMAASLALAGVEGCSRQPEEKIVPYVRAPEQIVPGRPLFYATAMPLGGVGLGVLVESHTGRPTKIEGNPQHPASLGATDVFAQSAVLGLYDPDRSATVLHNGGANTWSAFLTWLMPRMQELKARGGAGLRLLTGAISSPTLAWQMRELLRAYPAAQWHRYEPIHADAARAGSKLAFGRYLDAVHRFDRADVVLSLGADFLTCGPAGVRYARDFAARRHPDTNPERLNRLYCAESMLTATGAVADHRVAMRPGDIALMAHAVAAKLVIPMRDTAAAALPKRYAEWAAAVARDLRAHRGTSVVIAGARQPAGVHALTHLMNDALGNAGETVVQIEPVEAEPVEHGASLRSLVGDMQARRVDTLVIVGQNPVYAAPADLNFQDAMSHVATRVHLGPYVDETASQCHWHIPETHFLEQWGDVRAYDGTTTILQPLIRPLFAGRSAHELLAAMAGRVVVHDMEIVRDYWKTRFTPQQFEATWQTALHDGIVPNTANASVSVRASRESLEAASPPELRGAWREGEAVEIEFVPDPCVWDGRFANNGWLQELPKPVTKLTWDNAAHVSPAMAQRLGLSDEDVIELRYQERAVRAPVLIVPGHADGAVTVTLGYGRTRIGRVGQRAGFNAYALRTAEAPWTGAGLEIVKTGTTHRLARTQLHHLMEGRALARGATVTEFRKDATVIRKMGESPATSLTLYPGYDYSKGAAWGMAINLNACVGCNACVIACQAENNIPIVGKSEVLNSREMHWLRIDHYYEGDPAEPRSALMPVPCMQCENAPCELVCPVHATVHSAEGLNDMVYNRCVGTRYCSNNCPYKVRRFNFLQYSDYKTPSIGLMYNPDVTVRSRGVMEKCTYCVQRIRGAEVASKTENRSIQPGELMTACQQACPTSAIIFGDINRPTQRVAEMKRSPLNYALLGELNTRPRTTYLGRIRNPNPELREEHVSG